MEENRIKRPSATAAIILFFVFIAICAAGVCLMLSTLGIDYSTIISISGLIVGLIAAVALIRKKHKGALVSVSVLFFVNSLFYLFAVFVSYYPIPPAPGFLLIPTISAIILFVFGIIIALVKSNKIKSIVPLIVIGVLFLLDAFLNDLKSLIYYLPLIIAVVIACKYHINCTHLEPQAVAESIAPQQGSVTNQSKTSNIDVAEKIKEYKELLDLEIITQEEFDLKKKELLNTYNNSPLDT